MYTNSVGTVSVPNDVSSNTASDFAIQEQINTILKAGVLMVNQRVDSLIRLFVNSVQYQNFYRAAKLLHAIGAMLLGNWSNDLNKKMKELQASIIAVNNTRVYIATAK